MLVLYLCLPLYLSIGHCIVTHINICFQTLFYCLLLQFSKVMLCQNRFQNASQVYAEKKIDENVI